MYSRTYLYARVIGVRATTREKSASSHFRFGDVELKTQAVLYFFKRITILCAATVPLQNSVQGGDCFWVEHLHVVRQVLASKWLNPAKENAS